VTSIGMGPDGFVARIEGRHADVADDRVTRHWRAAARKGGNDGPPNLGGNVEALDFLLRAVERAGYRPGDDVFLALDVAASEFGEHGRYRLRADRTEKSSEEMIAFYEGLCGRYPICSIEDGLGEDDWSGWAGLTRRLGSRAQLVGDRRGELSKARDTIDVRTAAALGTKTELESKLP